MNNKLIWLENIKKIQSLSQSGLAYCKDFFDLERFQEIRELCVQLMAYYTDNQPEKVKLSFANEKGYQTPKVDIRAVVFNDNRILLVKENLDNCWALPGGWADIGCSPKENAKKEVKEEAGIDVLPLDIIALIDKNKHNHPPSPYHVYKVFIYCKKFKGELKSGNETNDVGFFERDALPTLSIERNTYEQIQMCFDYRLRQKVIID